MKNRLILMAWGVFFALYAQPSLASYAKGTLVGVYRSSSPVYSEHTRTPEFWGKEIVAEITNPSLGAEYHLTQNVSVNFRITKNVNGSICEIASDGRVLCDSVYVGSLRWSGIVTTPTGEETATCMLFDGDQFEGSTEYNSSSPRCINTGVSTGGSNSKPLLCQTKALIQTANGKWSHAIDGTAPECTAVSPPDEPDPDPNPDPDPDPDPDPEPEPDPGTPGGGGQPTSGTTGNTSGTSGSNPVNLVMDYKPVTERLDLLRADAKAHTNYLGQRINDASAAGVAATNSLKPLLEAIATKTDGVATAVREGNAEIKGELTNLNNTGKAIEGAIKDGNIALGEKLDGIKEGIDKLTDGEPIDGEAAGNSVALPDYDAAVRDGVQQIQSTVNQYAVDSGINDLTNRQAVTGMFEAAQSFADVFDIARSQCNPIAFGSRGTFNVCGAAPTISMVLEIIIWALTALFIFHFIGSLLTRERLT